MIVFDPLSSSSTVPSSAASTGASFSGPSVVPGVEAVQVSPGIGVGAVFDPTPSITASSLSRCRVRTDRAGLNLRAGEIVLCAAYEPVDLGMVVLVRCEADGHRPGALIPADEVELIGPALEPVGVSVWDKPGQRRLRRDMAAVGVMAWDYKDEATQAGLDHVEQVVDQAKTQATGRNGGALDDPQGSHQQ